MMDIDALREAVQVGDEDLTNDEARYLFVLLDCARERADALRGAAETAHEALALALDGP